MKSYHIYKYLISFLLLFIIILILPFSVNSNENNNKNYKEITQKLRCMTCQNQTVYESDAEFSKDIKKIVKEKLDQGQTSEQIEDFLVKRFCEYILFKPRLNVKNLFLWIMPFVLICLSAIILVIRLKNNKYN